MIQPASLIAFGLVFFGLTCGLSLLSCAALLLSRTRCRRRGPRVERLAAALAVVVPPLLGFAVTTALAVRSLASAWLGLTDHCPSHVHHLHLCLYHGAVWAREPWAVAALSGAAALLLVRLGQRALVMGRARSDVRALARIGRPVGGDVLLTPSDLPFCFVAGMTAPRIFVSSAAWERLGEDERRAVIEHERAHVAQGDLWRRWLLGGAALFGFPVLAGRTLVVWEQATERLCDRRSAEVVGEPAVVAQALLVLARAGAGRALPCAAGFVNPNTIVDRVEAILGDEPEGADQARRLGLVACLGMAVVVLGASLAAEPLHHPIETLLGAH
jgi:Zn-dependent protease with chaperone function